MTPAPGGWPPEVEAALGRCTFPAPGTELACAVSGGPDSLALLVLAAAAGLAVTAVHVDHGLRPGSSAEAGVVAAAARRFGAGFVAERVEVCDGPNLEARARAARFAVLPAGAATGHTMDDQAETVLLNLLRGAGLDGLAAMAPGPTHPLLGLRRAEARAVCRSVGLEWVEDPSNADPRHRRNRVRAELLPLCASIARRDPVPLLARLAALAGDEAVAPRRPGRPGRARPHRRRACWRRRRCRSPGAPCAGWLRRSAGGPAGRDGGDHPPSLADVERVLAVAGGRAVATEVSGGRRVRRSAGRLAVGVAGSGKVAAVETEEVARAGPRVGPVRRRPRGGERRGHRRAGGRARGQDHRRLRRRPAAAGGGA